MPLPAPLRHATPAGRPAASTASGCRPPSTNVRYQSSRLISAQIASPAVGGAGRVGLHQLRERPMIDETALARAAVEEHIARDVRPGAAHPERERHREAHLAVD